MQICLFLIGPSGRESLADSAQFQDIEGLRKLIVHEPIIQPVDPRIAPAADAPSCVLQLYFDELATLEAAASRDGPVHRALRAQPLAKRFTQQVMAVRALVLPTPGRETRAQRCTYLVAYEGPAEDFDTWLAHYLQHHAPLMSTLPALRELEIYTRIESTIGLPCARADAMQRNKVVFDDASALADALASPVRDLMRRDFHALPPYEGGTPHFAMRSTYGNLATH
ncbi:ethyl tert-butyl ether degradation protein EthD [Caballeronia sp. LZ062]|uniref:ethyl tert-butyl ether degradation protein EthD n=1 Tax=unclassified Caballeronia TaxID=2646786 RepID=UPI002856BF84|nr:MULTISPECIES: ethyl tert-butyl ether degradation protein EthD [unclassified Caballeronia]MDR5856179.1 ethyl tert-butyl ether degradation protein EthD [Caballeronia sp. LZ050]MDR5872850.1 ethyl tert-butyl ether degradation protein EthD [Caballeronia sp. LZ062]